MAENKYCHLVYEDDEIDCEYIGCEVCRYYYADEENERKGSEENG